MGNAFACSMLCGKVWRVNKEEAFRSAQLAAAQHERDGFRWLGYCFLHGVGCEEDLNLAKENFLIAAELGNVWAAEAFGELLHESDPVCWLWWGRASCVILIRFFVFFRNKSSDFSLALEMQQSSF